MKKQTIRSLVSILALSFILAGCNKGDEAKIEVDDKLLGDGQEVEIETPKGDVDIDIPSSK